VLSLNWNLTFVDVPLSISIPPSCEGVPLSSELRTIMLSPMFTVLEFTSVVVPCTTKFPLIVTSDKDALENVTSEVVVKP